MKVFTILLVVFCLMAPVARAQDSDRDADLAAQLTSLESAKFDAQQRKNNAALSAIFDDNLMLVDQTGAILSKSQFLAASQMAGTSVLRIAPKSMTVRVLSGIAIVVGIYEEKGMKSGHSYTRRCRFIDTWAFQNGRWVCIAETETPVIK